jgi:titin
VATAVSSSQISLTWTDNSLTENNYRIEQSAVDNLHYTEIDTVGPNATSYSATGLSEGTKYYYRVRASNAISTSAYSSEKNATTLFNIPVAPSGLRITTITSGSVSLAWTDNSGNESGFKVQRKQGATGAYTQIATLGANATTYTDNDNALLDGTQYYYKVCATNSAGDSSYSNEVNGITTMRVPTGLVATAVSSSQINLTWTDNSLSESGYKIEQSAVDNQHYSQIGVTVPNATSYSAIGLSAGTKYYYRMRAYNAIATSAYSSEKNATTLSSIPVAPSGLTITTVTSGSVSLAWTDNSNNETGFKIQRKLGATGGYTTINTVAANATTYTDSDSALLDGTQYYYKVCATNSAGDSPFSNEVNGITTMRVPTGLVATAVSSSQINLTWIDNSLAESGYKIEQSAVDNQHYSQIAVTVPNATSYSAIGLSAGTKYYYRIRAYNAIATSAYSSEKNATTLSSIPVAPSGLTITTLQPNRIIIGWTDNSNNETGFKIQRKGATGAYADLTTTGANATQYTDTTVPDGTLYYYRVCATNTAGDSAYSNEVNGITPLWDPTSLSATAVSSSQINLTWTDNSLSESGYRIEQSPVDDLHFVEIYVTGPNATSYNVTGLNAGTQYYYRVRAYNSITTSAYSGETNATTLSNIPVAPSGLTVTTTTSSSVSLAWTDNSNNETGFKIQRKQGATGAYTTIKTTLANVTTYTDSDSVLLDGIQYYYKVCATNSAGDSAYSNEVNGITIMRPPTGLSATAVSSSQINLTWTDNALAEDGYRIEQSAVDNLHYNEIAVIGPNQTSYNATGLNAGTKYYYRVRAYNSITMSVYSSEKNATTLSSIPLAPSGLTVTTLLSSKIIIAWTDNSNNETGFKVQRKLGATGTYTTITTTGANATTYSDISVTDGTSYCYRVAATNSAGDSPYSNEVCGTTPLAKPTAATATAVSSSQINLTWIDNSASETGYKIERKTGLAGTYSQIALVGANVQSYPDTNGLAPNTKYYYRVRATNGTLDSDYSNEPSATTFP